MAIRWLTAGESHGRALVGIISGLPAGLPISIDYINGQLLKRQQGFGRSDRQIIENDNAEIFSGIRHGETTGSPIAIIIENRDYENWRDVMSVELPDPDSKSQNLQPILPRPGHVDLAGALKWGLTDCRNASERASGRTTAMTVAIGALCLAYLMEFGTFIGSRIISYGKLIIENNPVPPTREEIGNDPQNWIDNFGNISEKTELEIKKSIDEARKTGDTLGGSVRAVAAHVPPGLGSCSFPDERLDSNIAKAAMAIPGVKAVEIGSGIAQSLMTGKDAHDPYSINVDPLNITWFGRSSNLCGGIEGGISNGEPISVTVMIKPISTVNPPNPSIDLKTRKGVMPTGAVRSDICAVEPIACVLEAALAIELASAHRDKFAGDTFDEAKRAFDGFMKSIL